MYVLKKRFQRPAIVASSTVGAVGDSLFVTDEISGRRFLIDTGAARSVFPTSSTDLDNLVIDRSIKLIAANGSTISTYGTRQISLRFGGSTYSWCFILAAVNQPLIGADFLANYELLVDVAKRRLLDSNVFKSITLHTAPGPAPSIRWIHEEKFLKILDEFPDIIRPQFVTPTVPHGVLHEIITRGPPVASRVRRLSPEKLSIAQAEFKEMEEMGIVRRSTSPWASPLHMVPKSNGEWRPCGDYRRLNQRTVPDKYPIPFLMDCTAKVSGCSIFSKIDLIRSYFQVPVHPESVPKTAIVTPFGSFEFLRMSFGLRNAAQTFMKVMHKVLHGLDFVFVYIDDILIFSHSSSEHEIHLRTVFQRFKDFGLIIRKEKCAFGQPSVEFLGHVIDCHGIQPLPSKILTVRDFPEPQTVKQAQAFAGLVNFYHRFIPNAASIMSPIYEVTGGRPRRLVWGESQKLAFIAAKKALSDATLLAHPIPGAPISLKTDASDIAVAAVLEQTVNGHFQPIAFFSRKLRSAERNYSTFDRELLAAHLAVRHFRYFLEGREFTLYTDHKPLVQALDRIGDPWSGRQQRQLSELSEYSITMKHIVGKENNVADTLSRISAVSIGLDIDELADAQTTDSEMRNLLSSNSKLQLRECPIPDSSKSLLCDFTRGRPRPYVPSSLRKKIFGTLHSVGHPSIRSTKRLISDRYVWPGLAKDVNFWTRACLDCQASKIHRHTKAPIASMPSPRRRFNSIHVDIVGPFPVSNGFNYLFTIIDRSSRWPEAIPMTDCTARNCAQALIHGWIARFGVPEHITSDRGAQFTSQFWTCLSELMGINLHHTTAYHPMSNGIIERTHRHLKSILMARLGSSSSWFQHLPWALLAIRATPKEDTGISSAEKLYGEPLVIPGEFFPGDSSDLEIQELRRKVGDFAPTPPPRTGHLACFVPKDLRTSSHVFVRIGAHRRPLVRPYEGPFQVVDRSAKAFKLSRSGQLDWVSVDRLKPAFFDELRTASGRVSRIPLSFLQTVC